jgi:hypothetical protein
MGYCTGFGLAMAKSRRYDCAEWMARATAFHVELVMTDGIQCLQIRDVECYLRDPGCVIASGIFAVDFGDLIPPSFSDPSRLRCEAVHSIGARFDVRIHDPLPLFGGAYLLGFEQLGMPAARRPSPCPLPEPEPRGSWRDRPPML